MRKAAAVMLFVAGLLLPAGCAGGRAGAELDEAEARIAELEDELSVLEAESDESRREVADLKGRLVIAWRQRDDLQDRLDEACAELAQLGVPPSDVCE